MKQKDQTNQQLAFTIIQCCGALKAPPHAAAAMTIVTSTKFDSLAGRRCLGVGSNNREREKFCYEDADCRSSQLAALSAWTKNHEEKSNLVHGLNVTSPACSLDFVSQFMGVV